jgi:hypothetical protein
LISVGDLEAAVTILLATPPNNPLFYMDALRAVSLASAVSPALHELAVKVVAANMVGTEDSLSGTHLLCAVGRYQEACSQLQDAGRWIDAATLAATHLEGSDHARVLERWAEHVLHNEHNLWRAMMLYVAAGALMEALDILRKANQPDTAAMFLLACHESKVRARASMNAAAAVKDCPPMIIDSKASANTLDLPGKLPQHLEEIQAVCEYYGQYQRLLAHMCTGITAFVD